MTVKYIRRSASFFVNLLEEYKSAVTLAPIGYPPSKPRIIGITPFSFILKKLLVKGLKSFERIKKDFDVAI